MPCVKVTQGLLRGIFSECENGSYFAFKGIPYAKPPIGDLRFKAPEPPEPWEGELNASEHGPVCPQYNERLDRIDEGSEDCLYLNVYSKNIEPTHPLPVMVWIHGGSFYTGSGNSDIYGPEFFMAHDVILVTFNYRLEILGFLCLDNEEVPGNAGLKDQVAALQWIKQNISSFGGNPDNITIFGCSAGAACASYHLISEMSQGLFNKAICQSGVCLNDWSYNLYPRQRAFQLGKLLGKETDNLDELLKFLKSIPASALVKIKLPTLDTKHKDLSDGLFFGPVVEKSELRVQKFISESPPDLVKKGQIAKVPLILGYTSGEGIELSRNLEHMTGMISGIGDVVPRELKLKFPNEKIQELDEKIREYYFKRKTITKEMVQEVTDFMTDMLFVFNIIRFAHHFSAHGSKQVYLYKFTAESDRNYVKKLYKMDNVRGVCHADELHYLFHMKSLPIPFSEESRRIIKQFVRLWTNFANSGNPTTSSDAVQWKPFNVTEQNIYIMDKQCKCAQLQDTENMKLYKNLYEETI